MAYIYLSNFVFISMFSLNLKCEFDKKTGWKRDLTLLSLSIKFQNILSIEVKKNQLFFLAVSAI